MTRRSNGPTIAGQQPSADTVRCLEEALRGALAGEVVGVVLAAVYRRRRYSVSVCGEARHDPTYARGVACAIDDELRELIHDRAQGDTTL